MQATKGGNKQKQQTMDKKEINKAHIRDDFKHISNQLPIEILNDLEECFNHYDEERNDWIPDHLFKNIL